MEQATAVGISYLSATNESAASIDDPLADAPLAEAVIFDSDRVLLIRRIDVPVWSLPGGHRDPGETAAASCVREVREETGLQVRIAGLLGWYERPYWLSGGRAAVYHCEPAIVGAAGAGTLTPGEHEGEARFWPVSSLPEPILYWYPPIIRAAYACRAEPETQGQCFDSATVSPTLGGFLRSLLRAPRLWFPLARYALRLYFSSRIAQHRAMRSDREPIENAGPAKRAPPRK